MDAATYGSRAVLCLLLTSTLDRRWHPDGTTALHCAASGGSSSPRSSRPSGLQEADADASKCRPADVIRVPPKMIDDKMSRSKICLDYLRLLLNSV
jgi:hypothetical protein